MPEKKALMYGAGNIGRGFIGESFARAGYEVVFVDVNMEIVGALNARRAYPVTYLDGRRGRSEYTVENVRAVDGRNLSAVAREIADCDIMATAVGVNVLPHIAAALAGGIGLRASSGRPVDIIICENLLGADEYLRGLIAGLLEGEARTYFAEKVGLVEASIGRMVPIQTEEMQGGDNLRVCVEPYSELPVDGAAFRAPLPEIANLRPFTPFRFYIERKLFIHNMGHAAAAWIGAYAGCEQIWQCMDDPVIALAVYRAMVEAGVALSLEHGVEFAEVWRNIEDLVRRFSNRLLGDTCFRVGRDLRRKLSPSDRVIGALELCTKHGVACPHIELAAAAALAFKDDMEPVGEARAFLRENARLSPGSESYGRITELYGRFERGEKLAEIIKGVE